MTEVRAVQNPGFVIGNIAKGDDMWDRKAEIDHIWKSLEKTSVFLKAPRRFGKTSIMFNLFENPRLGYETVFFDAEGRNDPEDFVVALAVDLISNSKFKKAVISTKKWFKEAFQRIEEIGLATARLKLKDHVRQGWQDKGFEILSCVAESHKKILFIIDELPTLIQNIATKHENHAACEFLNWFRQIRQHPKLPEFRWLVGGSIGIEYILEKVGTGPRTINDFEIINIGAFSGEEGRGYVKALLVGDGGIKRVSNVAIEKIMELVGPPVPYFIQILASESLKAMERLRRTTLTPEAIEEVFHGQVLGPASKTYFMHYYQRLKEYYTPGLARIAHRLVLEVARCKRKGKQDLWRLFKAHSTEKPDESAFNSLMTDLENDFYIIYNYADKTYGFSTNILRAWWLRYHDVEVV